MSDNERLAKIESMLQNLGEKMDAHVAEGKEWRSSLSGLLHGKDGSPGMVVRLDRLEQAAERSRWVMRTVIGAVIVLLVGGLRALLS